MLEEKLCLFELFHLQDWLLLEISHCEFVSYK